MTVQKWAAPRSVERAVRWVSSCLVPRQKILLCLPGRLADRTRASAYPPSLWVLAVWVRSHVRSERGASLVEYALLVSLLAVACAGAIQYMGDVSGSKLSSVSGAIGNPTQVP